VTAQDLLDQVHSLDSVTALEGAPRSYAERLAEELPPPTARDEIATRDERLRAALARIDAMCERVMRLRLEHVLANEPAIAVPTRKVFAATVVSYDDNLELLETRARDIAGRGGSPDPARAAAAVVDAARATLALRAALRQGVLALIAELAASSIELADGHARDRRLDENVRRAWSAVRRELEITAAQPTRVIAADFSTRLASWPDQLDDPDPADDPTVADLIELD
jgi:hypothetical protein